MKKIFLPALLIFLFRTFGSIAAAQCSICTKTAAQLGEKPARGLNTGILYLALIPVTLGVFIGYQWWKRNGRDTVEPEGDQTTL